MSYRVDTETFQGPLELLYKLIKKNRIEISQISLAQIAGQYLAYIERMEVMNLDNASQFMIIASELIAIKARSLLPEKETGHDEQDEDQDLVRRLEEYKIFRAAASWLKKRGESSGQRFYSPVSNPGEEKLELKNEPEELKQALLRALQSASAPEPETEQPDSKFEYLDTDRIKVEDKIEEIVDSVRENRGRVEFTDLIKSPGNYLEIAVTLLGLLELMRLDQIEVYQPDLFDNIIITSKG